MDQQKQPQTLRVLGIDPSLRGGGWFICDMPKKTFVAKGYWEICELSELFQTLGDTIDAYGVEAVAVETPEGAPAVKNSISLLATSGTAGMVLGFAQAKGLKVSLVRAYDWRRYIFGRSNPTNREIKFWFTPTFGFKGRSNDHERDAACTLWYAWETAFKPKPVSRKAKT